MLVQICCTLGEPLAKEICQRYELAEGGADNDNDDDNRQVDDIGSAIVFVVKNLAPRLLYSSSSSIAALDQTTPSPSPRSVDVSNREG